MYKNFVELNKYVYNKKMVRVKKKELTVYTYSTFFKNLFVNNFNYI